MSKKKQFPFVYVSGKLTHRSEKGSKDRYRSDKLCRNLAIQDLSIILERWDKRAKSETNQQRRRELKTCCKITDGFHPDAYWDAEEGIVIGEDTLYI